MNLAFMGTPDFAVPALNALVAAGHTVSLVVTQPDRPKGRGHAPAPPPAKLAAVELGIDAFQPEDVNSAEAIERIRSSRPEAIVVAAYGQKLGRRLLELPPSGCINVHASLLPRYRGAAPIAAALLAGDAHTGVTIMQMAEAIDAGDILAQRATPIAPDENAGQLHDRMARLGAELLVDTLVHLERGDIVPQPQDHSRATFAPKLSKADGALDFTRNADTLARVVRAMTPWPGATARLHLAQRGKDLAVLVLKASATPGPPGEPGVVTGASAAGIEVATGGGRLLITRLQQSGKRPLAAAEFLRGHPVQPGDRFAAPASSDMLR